MIYMNVHDHTHAQNRFAVIPTEEKLNANATFTGRGVTVAFLDSGFYPHPDFASRVVAFHDIAGDERSFKKIVAPRPHHWHGTQTVVSCAGDGTLSDGIYRGLASDVDLVLVKVSRNGRIGDEAIEKGLRWVIKNREKYNIRVLNMSLGGDVDLPTTESCVNKLAEQLIASGVVVTVAAGNSAESSSIPPASAPSAITVGGYSDENQFESEGFELYHSSFGATADGLIKPELIAPAMFVAAPILPETPDYKAAEALSQLAAEPDYGFPKLLQKLWQSGDLDCDVLNHDIGSARRLIEESLVHRKVVATHYQHVDGTSFAAPIAASVVAQMLEANPNLTPTGVKNILVSTAVKLGGHPRIRQGFGILNAPLAVEKARVERHFLDNETYFPPRIEGGEIIFTHHDDDATSVNLCGDFNEWRPDEIRFERSIDGLWLTKIPCQPVGRYRYKLLVNGMRWTEDPSHGLKEDDGLGGFHSILNIG
jgi:serine protease AprX